MQSRFESTHEGRLWARINGKKTTIQEMMKPYDRYRRIRTRESSTYTMEFLYTALRGDSPRDVKYRVQNMLDAKGITARKYVATKVAAVYNNHGLIVAHAMQVTVKIIMDAQLELAFDLEADSLTTNGMEAD